MEVFICQKMGEETVYMRNLKKQAYLQNNEAISLLSGIQSLKMIQARILDIIKDFDVIGLHNVAVLLQNLHRLAKPEFHQKSSWILCSFTGKICANVIYFENDNVKYYVDIAFRHFLYTFWVCFNIKTLEYARAAAYMSAHSSLPMSMHERITKFMYEEHEKTEEAAQFYFDCFSYTMKSLDTTIENHRITMTCLPDEERRAVEPTAVHQRS